MSRILLTVIFVLMAFPQLALSKGITNHVVSVEQSDSTNEKSKENNKKNSQSYAVTVESIGYDIGNSVGNAETNKQYYEDGSNKVDCNKAATFSDLVACKSLDTQNSIDKSTVGIWDWTVASAIFAAFAFIAGTVSVLLLWWANKISGKTFNETRKANILSLQPYFKIVFDYERHNHLFHAHEGKITEVLSFDVINIGNSPAKDVSAITINNAEVNILRSSPYVVSDWHTTYSPDFDIFIAPKEVVTIDIKGVFTNRNINKEVNGTKMTFEYHGEFTYTDIESIVKVCEFVIDIDLDGTATAKTRVTRYRRNKKTD